MFKEDNCLPWDPFENQQRPLSKFDIKITNQTKLSADVDGSQSDWQSGKYN